MITWRARAHNRAIPPYHSHTDKTGKSGTRRSPGRPGERRLPGSSRDGPRFRLWLKRSWILRCLRRRPVRGGHRQSCCLRGGGPDGPAVRGATVHVALQCRARAQWRPAPRWCAAMCRAEAPGPCPAARCQHSDGQHDGRPRRRLCLGVAAEPVKSEVIMHLKTSGIKGIKDPVCRIRLFREHASRDPPGKMRGPVQESATLSL